MLFCEETGDREALDHSFCAGKAVVNRELQVKEAPTECVFGQGEFCGY